MLGQRMLSVTFTIEVNERLTKSTSKFLRKDIEAILHAIIVLIQLANFTKLMIFKASAGV